MEKFKVRNRHTGAVCDVVRTTDTSCFPNEASYEISWDAGEHGIAPHRVTYDEWEFGEALHKYLAVVEEEKVELADKFVFTHRDSGTSFEARRAPRSDTYCLRWWNDHQKCFSEAFYPLRLAEKFVKDGVWIIDAAMTEQLVKEGELATTADGPVWTEVGEIPGLLSYDSELNEWVGDFEITVEAVSQFCADTGAFVELDGEFYTVTYGGNTYPTKSATKLTSVMEAIRTLEEARDLG